MNASIGSRILIVGSPGSGKSTFARALEARTHLPLYYLDMIQHRPDHTEVPNEVFDARLAEILAEPDWIIDGNYNRTLPMRLTRAQTVFLFDLPTETCLRGIHDRIGRKRVDMPWEPETALDPEFEQYVRDFANTKRPWLLDTLAETRKEGRNVIVFRSRGEAHRFLRSLPPAGAAHA